MKQREREARAATEKAKAKATAERIGSDIKSRLLKCSRREARLSMLISMLFTPFFKLLYLTKKSVRGRGEMRKRKRR
jgi:hypothetical protein